jgi:hypothetical protein
MHGDYWLLWVNIPAKTKVASADATFVLAGI